MGYRRYMYWRGGWRTRANTWRGGPKRVSSPWTPEKRREAARKAAETKRKNNPTWGLGSRTSRPLTPQERSEAAKRGAETRRRNRENANAEYWRRYNAENERLNKTYRPPAVQSRYRIEVI